MALRLLADENLPAETVEALRREGHDVLWAPDEVRSRADEDVLRRAAAETRTLLTFDKDFGELAFRSGLTASAGVILLRIGAASPSRITRVVLAALNTTEEWSGYFSVVEDDRIRKRPLE